MNTRNNYNKISERYDQLRSWEDDFPRRALELAVGNWARDGALLELGCGTGNFTHWIAKLWPGRVVATDPSEGMLTKARGKLPGVQFVKTGAEQLPFQTDEFQAATGAFFIHHLDAVARHAACRELRRVLRKEFSGVALVTASHPQIRTCTLARWFPKVADLDCARFPDLGVLELEFRDAGFSRVEFETISRIAPNGGVDYLARVKGHFVSTLELLPPEDFQRGVEAMERQLEREGSLGDVSVHATIVHAH